MRLSKGIFAQTCAATAGAVVLFAAGSAKAAQYSGGSLIIPMQSVFQNNCGVVSAYGLVYDLLRANDGLAAAGKPRIVVHWAYKGTKASPNRCVPTDQSRPPPYGSYSAGNPPPWDDPIWNDGCDFRVTDSSSLPVTQIDNTTGDPAKDTLITTINTTADTTVSPTYPSATITQVGATKVTSVGYLGGPFVIAASDVPVFLQLLTGQLVVNDAQTNPVDFTAFRTPGSCTLLGATHFVAIHRAMTSFTADDNLSFNQTPPRAALLDTGLNVSGGILNTYLANAGLVFTGSFGCPPGGVNSTNTAKCPTGKPGIIFDYFDLLDLTNNLMALTDSKGKPLYRAVWTPHWEVGSVQLTPPKGITVVKAAPGTLTASTYYYRVTALSGVGETLPSSPESVSPATTGNHALTITWPAVPNAVSYNVYGRTTGAEQLIASVDGAVTTPTPERSRPVAQCRPPTPAHRRRRT
jgi:type IV pilus assembly protein PilY1